MSNPEWDNHGGGFADWIAHKALLDQASELQQQLAAAIQLHNNADAANKAMIEALREDEYAFDPVEKIKAMREQLAAANARIEELEEKIEARNCKEDDEYLRIASPWTGFLQRGMTNVYVILPDTENNGDKALGNGDRAVSLSFNIEGVDQAEKLLNVLNGYFQQVQQLESTIAACKAAGFVTEQGEVRKVLGTLPITADGVIVGQHKERISTPLWVTDIGSIGTDAGWIGTKEYLSYFSTSREVSEAYSTREAAEAAKGGRER